ncbi:hypothetical protein NUSPORA_00616 [Nucleospora cyclopteri]
MVNDKSAKKLKIEDRETSDSSESSNDESFSRQEVFEYNSEIDQDSDGYFTETDECSEESENAWEDSEETPQNKLNLTGGDTKKTIKMDSKAAKFAIKKGVFTARCKIKLIKAFTDVFVMVDTFNLIYVITHDFKESKTYKVKFFKISDFFRVGEKIFFISETSSFIYALNIKEEKIETIRKGLGNVAKTGVFGEKIYLMGERLIVTTKEFDILNDFKETFISMAFLKEFCFALKESGEIYKFDLDLNLIDTFSLSSKFSFKVIFSDSINLIIGAEASIIFVDENCKEIKTRRSQKEPPCFSTANKVYTLFASKQHGSVKIVKKNTLESVDNFPNKLLGTSQITGLTSLKNKIYVALCREITEFTLEEEKEN